MASRKAQTMKRFRYFEIERVQNAVIARIVDSQLVGSISEFLRLELRELLTSPDFRALVIDFKNVKMISSSSIQTLLNARDHAFDADVEIRLAAMQPSVLYVFETLNLVGTVFRIFDSTDEALENLGAAPTFFDKHGRYCPKYEDEDAQ